MQLATNPPMHTPPDISPRQYQPANPPTRPYTCARKKLSRFSPLLQEAYTSRRREIAQTQYQPQGGSGDTKQPETDPQKREKPMNNLDGTLDGLAIAFLQAQTIDRLIVKAQGGLVY